METQEELTPKESLDMIREIISESRSRLEEDGFIYIFWGILIALASFGQYYLLTQGMYEVNYYPYFILPLGGVYTYFYYSRKENRPTNHIGKSISVLWIVLGLNMFALGFSYGMMLDTELVPVLLILLGIGIAVSGRLIQSTFLTGAGVVPNLLGLVCFFLPQMQHSLVMGIVAIVGVALPGFYLRNQHRKNHV